MIPLTRASLVRILLQPVQRPQRLVNAEPVVTIAGQYMKLPASQYAVPCKPQP